MRAQRLQLLDFHGRFVVTLGTRVNLVLGSDPEHGAGLAHAQPLGIHDDLKSLVPRHILQTQSQGTCHRIRGDDIEVGEVRDDLQQRAHFNILEIERQLFAAVARALRQLAGVDLFLAHFHHELIVALVCAVLPVTHRVNAHPNTIALLSGRYRLHRRTEIPHIELLAQIFRQSCTQEVHRQALALLPQIHPHLAAAKADYNPAGAIATTAKVDTANRSGIRGCRLVLEHRSHDRSRSCSGCRGTCGIKQDQQRFALALQAIGRSRLQIQYQA